jgi:hypothetical protein
MVRSPLERGKSTQTASRVTFGNALVGYGPYGGREQGIAGRRGLESVSG